MELAQKLLKVAKEKVSYYYKVYSNLEPGYDDAERIAKYREYVAVRNVYYAMLEEQDKILERGEKNED